MEAMEKVIENVEGMESAKAAQTAIQVATTKPSHNGAKTGGIIAGAAALVMGIGYVIYRAIKDNKPVMANEPVCEEEPSEDNEVNED